MAAPYFFRRRLWIKPAFQGRLLLHMGSYLLLSVLVVCLMVFLLSLQKALVAKQVKGELGLYAAYLADIRPLFWAAIILTPYFIYDLIKFSHRIAGPLYRCQSLMRQMAEGKPVPEFHPRTRDLMPEFFADFNALIKVHNSRIAAEGNGQTPAAQPRRDLETARVEKGNNGVQLERC